MNVWREKVDLGAGDTLRVLRWRHRVDQVELVRPGGPKVAFRGAGTHWHYHRAFELTWIRRGSGIRFVGDCIELFESDDLVLLGTNVPHYWHLRGDSAGLCVQWDAPPEHGLWAFGETEPLRERFALAGCGVAMRGRTAEAVCARLERLTTTAGLDRLAVFFDLLSVLASAPRRDLRTLCDKPWGQPVSMHHEEAIRRAVSYVIAHHQRPIRISELLELTGMSRARFNCEFRRHTGKSCSMFLNEVRLNAVCRALRDTDEPIGAIALSHGFNQLSFFNRLFRRELRMNPRQYRSKHLPPVQRPVI